MPSNDDEARRAALSPVVQEALRQVPLGLTSTTVDRTEYMKTVNRYEEALAALREENAQQRLDFLAERERLIQQNQELQAACHRASLQLQAMGAKFNFKTEFAKGVAAGAAPLAVDVLAEGLFGRRRGRR